MTLLEAVIGVRYRGRRQFYLMRHFALRIHRNIVNNGLALIYICSMYGTGAVLALDEQKVRL